MDCILLIPLVHGEKGATSFWQSAGHWPRLIWDLLSLFHFQQPSLARRSIKHSQTEEEIALLSCEKESRGQRKRQRLTLTRNKNEDSKMEVFCSLSSRIFLEDREQKLQKCTKRCSWKERRNLELYSISSQLCMAHTRVRLDCTKCSARYRTIREEQKCQDLKIKKRTWWCDGKYLVPTHEKETVREGNKTLWSLHWKEFWHTRVLFLS